MDLWYWLFKYAVAKHERDKKPNEFLFDLYNQSISQTNEKKKSTLDRGKRESQQVICFLDLRAGL